MPIDYSRAAKDLQKLVETTIPNLKKQLLSSIIEKVDLQIEQNPIGPLDQAFRNSLGLQSTKTGISLMVDDKNEVKYRRFRYGTLSNKPNNELETIALSKPKPKD